MNAAKPLEEYVLTALDHGYIPEEHAPDLDRRVGHQTDHGRVRIGRLELADHHAADRGEVDLPRVERQPVTHLDAREVEQLIDHSTHPGGALPDPEGRPRARLLLLAVEHLAGGQDGG